MRRAPHASGLAWVVVARAPQRLTVALTVSVRVEGAGERHCDHLGAGTRIETYTRIAMGVPATSASSARTTYRTTATTTRTDATSRSSRATASSSDTATRRAGGATDPADGVDRSRGGGLPGLRGLSSGAGRAPVVAGPSVAGSTPARSPADKRKRTAILNDMVRDMKPPASDPMRARIRVAMESFSVSQLTRMRDQGVEFAGAGGIPKDRQLPGGPSAKAKSTPGRYVSEARTVHIDGRASVGQIRHELAHAWDDVRNDRTRLDDSKSASERRNLETRIKLNNEDAAGQYRHYAAEAKSPNITKAGRDYAAGEANRLREVATTTPGFASDSAAMRAAYDAYSGRVRGNIGKTFEATADKGHSLDNAREFYAHGFNTFHGRDDAARAKLQRYAPELYAQLHREARAEGTLPAGVTPPR